MAFIHYLLAIHGEFDMLGLVPWMDYNTSNAGKQCTIHLQPIRVECQVSLVLVCKKSTL